MLNKNGKLMLAQASSISKSAINTDGTVTATRADSLRNPAYTNMWVGTGTSPATVDDYNLESRNEDLNLIIHQMVVSDNVNNNYAMTLTATFENNTSNDITITELGWISTYNSTTFLLVREVIDPVVIPSGGSKTFTITIG